MLQPADIYGVAGLLLGVCAVSPALWRAWQQGRRLTFRGDFISGPDAPEDRIPDLLAETAQLRSEVERLTRLLAERSSAWAEESTDWDDVISQTSKNDRQPDPEAERHRKALRVLGLPATSSASSLEIRAAYIAQVKRFHPDNGGTAAQFRAVLSAYRVLTCGTD